MMRKVYQSILKCDCGNSFLIEEGRIHCTRCDKKYHASKSYINFFEDETKRPYWSMHMQNAFKEHGIVLNMGEKYDAFERFYLKNEAAQDFFGTIRSSSKVIIDLASGPSGYFGKLIKDLDADQFFIITDGSPMIIDAHMNANKNNANVGYIDMDLDKALPLNNGSVDCFMGRFLDNVMAYKNLFAEIHRCLKIGGRFSVMELFYQEGSEENIELENKNSLYASIDGYIAFCASLGLRFEKKAVVETYIGKLDPSDSMPKNDTDIGEVFAMHFIKE